MSAISGVDIRDMAEDQGLLEKKYTQAQEKANREYRHGQAFPNASAQAVLAYELNSDKKMIGAGVVPSTRTSVLNEANSIVNGARNQAYGSAEDNFKNIADLWSAYKNVTFTAIDVAQMMLLMKVARLKHTPNHRDSWVDIAGYAACGAEIGLKDKK